MGKMKTVYPAIMIMIMIVGQIIAQYSTAEYLTSVLPPVVTGETKVPDGNRTLEFHDPYLFVGNQWFGIQIIDVSNPVNPAVTSEIKVSGSPRNAVYHDDYLYISDADGGIYIYNVSNISSPQKIKYMRLGMDVQWVSLEYPYLYLGLGEDGFAIYEISEPENPVQLSLTKTRNFVWELTKNGNYLYVSDNRGGLRIFDIQNPESPQLAGVFDTPNMVRSVIVDGNYAYVADGPGGLWIIDVTKPEVPSKISHVDVNGFSYGVYKSGQYVYLADEKKGLQIINVSDPSHPVTERNVVPESPAYDVFKHNIYLYLCTDQSLKIYRHDNPPVLADVPDLVIDENSMLTYQLNAHDPDNDPIFYTMINLPDGAKFDTTTGYFEWTPSYDQAGSYSPVIFKVIENTSTKLEDKDTITITVNNVNRAPSLAEIERSEVNENELFELIIPEGTDPDKEDKGKLVYMAENLPEGASFSEVERKFSWKPTFEQSGTYLIDFLVKDLGGLVDRKTFALDVKHVDRPPFIDPVEPIMAKENSPVEITLTGMDPDKEDADRVKFFMNSLPEGAEFNADNKIFKWTPTYDQSGKYRMVAGVTSGPYTDSTVIEINVEHVNRSPLLAVIEPKTINEMENLKVTLTASDPDVEDEGKLTLSAAGLPEGATFDPESGTFNWTPSFEQSGIHEITFTVADPQGLKDQKTLKITVNHVNRPPVLANVENKVIDENQLLSFTLNGSDPDKEDSGKLKYMAEKLPEGATLDAVSGAFSWTPTFDQSGQYNVLFMVTDGEYSDSQLVAVTVNHVNRPPVLAEISQQNVNENELLSFIVSGSDPDVEDEGKLVFSTGPLPEGAQFNAETRTFSWTPTFEQSGSYTVLFKVTDPSGLVDSKEATIVVHHVNRVPVITQIEPLSIDENKLLEFALNGSDPDKEDIQKIKYFAENLPEGASLDPATGLFTWTPTFDQSGEYKITFGITDGELKASFVLPVTVVHVNRPPKMDMISDVQVNEDEILNVVINVSDPDKEDIGKLTVDMDGIPEGGVFDKSTLTFSWKPTFDQSGEYTLNAVVSDPAGLTDQKSFRITVVNVNRAPSLEVPPSLSTKENETIQFTISGSDPDKEDVGKLSFTTSELPAGAVFDPAVLTFTWTPTYEQSGTYEISFKVTDVGGLQNVAITSINVEHVNRPPQLEKISQQVINEGEAFTYTIIGSDPDKEDQDKLTYKLSGQIPTGLTLSGNTLNWTPGFDQSGNYSFNVELTDGLETVSTEMTVEVIHVNRPPEIKGINDQQLKENEAWTYRIEASDPDAEDQNNLNISVANLPEGCSFDESAHLLKWTPGYDQSGDYKINITVTDGNLNAEAVLNIHVQHVNRSPILEDIGNVQGKEGEKLTVPITYSDPDAEDKDKLVVTFSPQLKGMKFNSGTGMLEWNPDFTQAGVHTLKVTVSDGELSSSKEFNITIENVNRSPEIKVPTELTGEVGKEISFTVEGSDPDTDDKLIFSASGMPEGAEFDGESGKFKWIPGADQSGEFDVTFKVSDKSGAEVTKTVKITIKSVEANPTEGN
ncbi:MAG: hypothetical protein Kow00108_04310 [Calditrichia bacterium]